MLTSSHFRHSNDAPIEIVIPPGRRGLWETRSKLSKPDHSEPSRYWLPKDSNSVMSYLVRLYVSVC
jgi:hypothetical protein